MNQILHTLQQISENIGYDLLEPISYIPSGVAAGVVFLILWEVWHRFLCHTAHSVEQHKIVEKRRKWILFLCVVYIVVLLNMAFFSREPGSRTEIDLTLFGTWGTTTVAHAYVIENIIMFIPFGFLFPLGIRFFRNPILCMISGFVFSVCIEIMQLLTERGHCQLDDIVTNTLGTGIGVLCYYIYRKCRKGKGV